MNVMPPQNPLLIAEKSMQMGKESGDRNFRWVALVMMAATGLGVLLQAGHTIWRDLREERRYRRRNAQSFPAGDQPEQLTSNRSELQDEAALEESRWTGKPGLVRRSPEALQQRTAYGDTAVQGRQR